MDFYQLWHWIGWTTRSPYSPRNLSHLPQPVPKDAPVNLQHGIFTFEDAFEDLLAATCGQKLQDIDTKYAMRKLLRQVFPGGEDPRFWLHRLYSQRLLDNGNFYPPLSRPMWEDGVWGPSHAEFGRRDSEHECPDPWSVLEMLGARHPRNKRAGRKEEEARAEDTMAGCALGKEKKDVSGHDRSYHTSQAIDDVFSTLQSAVSHGAPSLFELVKSCRESFEEIKDSLGDSSITASGVPSARPVTERVESTEEWVDGFGTKHVRRTVKILNGQGEEVGREVFMRIQSSNESRRNVTPSDRTSPSPSLDSNRSTSGTSQENPENPRKGWFWK